METTERKCQRSSRPPGKHAPLQKHVPPFQTALAPRQHMGLSWKKRSPVGAGLQNTGNTCYLNATLQCLTHTGPLASHMLRRMPCHQKTCMMRVMQAHVRRAFQRSGDIIQPSDALGAGFHTHKQEDAHEFLLFLLDAMQKCQACGPEAFELPAEEQSLIREIFGGYWRSRIECLQCHSISDTLEPFLDITLEVAGAHSVAQALGRLVKPEELSGEDAYHCAACLHKVSASKTLTLQSASKVLILVLKRFSSWTGDKVDKEVHFPESLDMQPYMSQHTEGPLLYDLYAVLVHAGSSSHTGHYFSYIKAGNGQWYKMDDTKVTTCDASSALSQRAYILFYSQKSTDGERHPEDVFIGRDSVDNQAEEKEGRTPQPDRNKHSPLTLVEPQPDVPSTVLKEISLDQWKFFQDQNRPKSQLQLRKVEFTQDANLVVIHPSKHTDEMRRENHADKENSSPKTCCQNTTGQISRNQSQQPCEHTRARSHKRRNKQGKQGKKPLLVYS
ncbi:ubiquitin carboxyl-terminal hydrolase 17-like protein 6 [Dipodomys merriami]|uniref:ubiquitin carboxyl-terminal hydrolase 17-like protein 6 n=1 Tax=Dipodomys merriami TaxID=94247 RepID=UPI00385572CA